MKYVTTKPVFPFVEKLSKREKEKTFSLYMVINSYTGRIIEICGLEINA